MPVCVKCQLVKPGVKLCADDLLCPECYQDNERQLSEMKKIKSASLTVVQDSSTTPTELTNKTRASKTRQSKAKKQPAENLTTNTTDIEGHSAIPKLCSSSVVPVQPIDQITMQPILTAPVPSMSSAALTTVTAEDISAWREIAQKQQLTIDSLQRQLNFVLSFLGITDSNCVVMKTCTNDCITSMGMSTVQSEDPSDTSQSSCTLYASSVNQDKLKSQAKSQGQAKSQANQGNLNPFQQVVLATVDAESRRKLARQANIVISGLPMSTQKTDAELVQQLLSVELSISSKIASCQRLGKPASGKIQLLKVCTTSAKEAADVVDAAKRLRHSTDNYISKNVFINRDMTKSEAESAYQARCRRRYRNDNQQQHHQQSSEPLTSDLKITDNGVSKSQSSFDGQIDNSITQQASISTVPPQFISPPIPPQNMSDGRLNQAL